MKLRRNSKSSFKKQAILLENISQILKRELKLVSLSYYSGYMNYVILGTEQKKREKISVPSLAPAPRISTTSYREAEPINSYNDEGIHSYISNINYLFFFILIIPSLASIKHPSVGALSK